MWSEFIPHFTYLSRYKEAYNEQNILQTFVTNCHVLHNAIQDKFINHFHNFFRGCRGEDVVSNQHYTVTIIMATSFVPKMIPMSWPIIGQYFDTTTVASTDEEWLKKSIKSKCWKDLETVSRATLMAWSSKNIKLLVSNLKAKLPLHPIKTSHRDYSEILLCLIKFRLW